MRVIIYDVMIVFAFFLNSYIQQHVEVMSYMSRTCPENSQLQDIRMIQAELYCEIVLTPWASARENLSSGFSNN